MPEAPALPEMENLLLLDEVAEWLRVSEKTILRLVHDGQLPAIKVGGQWRFRRRSLERWLQFVSLDDWTQEETRE